MHQNTSTPAAAQDDQFIHVVQSVVIVYRLFGIFDSARKVAQQVSTETMQILEREGVSTVGEYEQTIARVPDHPNQVSVVTKIEIICSPEQTDEIEQLLDAGLHYVETINARVGETRCEVYRPTKR